MAIKFVPPLNWTVRVPGGTPRAGAGTASDEGGRRGDAVRVQFTAMMAEKDHVEVKRTGVRLEVWTNALAGTGGEWRAIPLEEDSSAAAHDALDEIDGEDVLDLGPRAAEGDQPISATFTDLLPSPSSPSPSPSSAAVTASTTNQISNQRAHVYRTTLSLPPTPHQKYAFTYRLVRPSGDIRWIGTDSTNGLIHVLPQDGCVLEHGEWKWTHSEGAHEEPAWLRSYSTAEGAEGSFVIANLDLTAKTWIGWGIGHDGRSVHNFELPSKEDLPTSRLLYLIPTSKECDSAHLPSPISVRALSWNSPISINKSGALILHAQNEAGRSSVERRVHNINSIEAFRRLRSEVVLSVPAPQILEINKDGEKDAIIFTPSHDSDGAMTIFVQPLNTVKSRRVYLPRSALERFIPSTSSMVALFNPRTKACVFADHKSSEPITLLTNQNLTTFNVIPMYDINDDPRAKWQIGLTKLTSVPELISVKMVNPLPTPPASPRTKPRQNVSFVVPVEEKQPKEVDSLETSSSSRTAQASPESTTRDEASLSAPSPDSPGATSLALLSRAKGHAVNRARDLFGDGRIFAAISVFVWFLGLVIRRAFRTFLPASLQSRLDGLVWYLLSSTTGSSSVTHVRRGGEKKRVGSKGRGSVSVSKSLIEADGGLGGGAPEPAESFFTKAAGSADEEMGSKATTSHLFIDPVPFTTSPGTIEPADYTTCTCDAPPSTLGPSKSESTKAARWDVTVPLAGAGGRHSGLGGGKGDEASMLHLLVRQPPVASGAAAPHDALYVEVGGSEIPLLGLCRSSAQGRKEAPTKAQAQAVTAPITEDPTSTTGASTAKPSLSMNVFAIPLPELAQKNGTSVLVRLRT